MAKEETTVKNFKINYLSKEQYNQEKIAGRINDNEIYMTPAEKVTNGLDLKEELVARASTCPINFANEGVLMYENGVYVAVECFNYNDSDYTLKTAYSTDGETWSLIDLPYVGYSRFCSCGGGKFIIISEQWNYDEDTELQYCESRKCVYSTDGVNWTAEDVSLPQGVDINTDIPIIFGYNKYYCIAAHVGDGTPTFYILSSLDGITWNIAHELSAEYAWNFASFSYANDKIILFANDGFEVYSTDGVAWNTIEIDYPYEHGNQHVVYGNGKYVYCGLYANQPIMVSDDGISWNYTSLSVSMGAQIHGLTFGSNGFVILLYRSSHGMAMLCVTRSDDGMNWSPITEKDWDNPIVEVEDNVS